LPEVRQSYSGLLQSLQGTFCCLALGATVAGTGALNYKPLQDLNRCTKLKVYTTCNILEESPNPTVNGC